MPDSTDKNFAKGILKTMSIVGLLALGMLGYLFFFALVRIDQRFSSGVWVVVYSQEFQPGNVLLSVTNFNRSAKVVSERVWTKQEISHGSYIEHSEEVVENMFPCGQMPTRYVLESNAPIVELRITSMTVQRQRGVQ